MVNSDPESLPTSADPGGLCPRCNRVSTFSSRDGGFLKIAGTIANRFQVERVLVMTCRGCEEATVLVERRANERAPWQPVSWWPTPGAGTYEPSIPEPVWKAYEEGLRCLGVQVPNAAAAMLRSCLAQVVQDKGSDEAKDERSLNDALRQMVKDGSLHPLFEDWVGQIRDLGNAGAHPEIFGDVTQDEAEELRRLVGQLLEVVYVQPARIQRAREARGRS